MSINENKYVDIQTAFALAEKIAKSKSPKAKLILDFIVNKNIRGYLNLCYAYLRWVDDFIDSPLNKLSEKIKFISRQKNLLESFLSTDDEVILSREESFLFHFISYASSQKKLFLIDAVRMMLEAIEMDAMRLEHDGIYTDEKMRLYLDMNSKAFFDIMTEFVQPKNPYTPKNLYIGKFTARLFMLRDMEKDFQLGFINIPREHLVHYGINSSNLKNDMNISYWVKNEFDKIIDLLYEEAVIVKTFPLKLKIFNYYSQIYYLPKIFRLKAAGFNPFKSTHKLSFIKNVKVYIDSFLLSMKLFRIEFL